EVGGVGTTIGGSDTDQDVVSGGLGVFHDNVEIAILVEDPRVHELILAGMAVALPIFFHELAIGKRRLGILVQVFHIGVCRGGVEIEVVLLHIFAMIPFAPGE